MLASCFWHVPKCRCLEELAFIKFIKWPNVCGELCKVGKEWKNSKWWGIVQLKCSGNCYEILINAFGYAMVHVRFDDVDMAVTLEIYGPRHTNVGQYYFHGKSARYFEEAPRPIWERDSEFVGNQHFYGGSARLSWIRLSWSTLVSLCWDDTEVCSLHVTKICVYALYSKTLDLCSAIPSRCSIDTPQRRCSVIQVYPVAWLEYLKHTPFLITLSDPPDLGGSKVDPIT